MMNKLMDAPDKIPTPSRDEMMAMFDVSWKKQMSEVNIVKAFKQNGITLAFDGSEDHLLCSSLR